MGGLLLRPPSLTSGLPPRPPRPASLGGPTRAWGGAPGPPSNPGFRGSRGPLRAPDPRARKTAKNGTFFAPSGAKSWGSGGAPPTNLILLRNQRRARLGTTARRPSTPRPQPRPPQPHPAPPSPVVGGGGGWWLGLGWWSPTGEVFWREARGLLFRVRSSEGGVTSVFAGYDCGVASLLCPIIHRRRRSYRVPSLDDDG